MTRTDQYAPLAVTTRNGHDESLHHGALVALDADGSVAFAVGDPSVEIYPRSTIKPLQAAVMVDAGLDLTPELLALVCASHDGAAEHIAGVRRILAVAGLDEGSLANTADLPFDAATARKALMRGEGASRLAQTCSGKHAGMLVTSVINGWPADASYLDSEHPLQQRILAAFASTAGEQPAHVGIDGCGSPAPVVTLVGTARMLRSITTGAAGPGGLRVVDAMRTYPDMVGGPARPVSLLMSGISGLIAKDGAEGVCVAGLPDGRTVALKVADGAPRPFAPVMFSALDRLGIDVSGVAAGGRQSLVRAHGAVVGEVLSLL